MNLYILKSQWLIFSILLITSSCKNRAGYSFVEPVSSELKEDATECDAFGLVSQPISALYRCIDDISEKCPPPQNIDKLNRNLETKAREKCKETCAKLSCKPLRNYTCKDTFIWNPETGKVVTNHFNLDCELIACYYVITFSCKCECKE